MYTNFIFGTITPAESYGLFHAVDYEYITLVVLYKNDGSLGAIKLFADEKTVVQ